MKKGFTLIEFIIIIAIVGILISLFLPNIIKVVNGEVVKSKYPLKSWEEERIISCSLSGYCYNCDLGFDRDMNCGIKYRSNCSQGSRLALIRFTEFEVIYKNGKEGYKKEMDIVKYLTDCRE